MEPLGIGITNARKYSSAETARADRSAASGQPLSSVRRHGTEVSTVTLSARGRLAAQLDMESLESRRAPNWMIDFVPKQNIVSPDALQETRAHLATLDRMKADGGLSADEKRFMMDRLANHSPATQKMHAHAEFRERFRDELDEYAGILETAYEEARQENGVTSREDYINKVLNAPDDNRALRDSLATKLLDNPRALELMDTLGIDRPSVQPSS